MLSFLLGVGPGAYEIKSGIGTRPMTRILDGSKINIIQEIAERRAFTPGPGHYMSFRDPTPDMLVGRKKLAFVKTVADRNRKRAATGLHVCSVPWSSLCAPSGCRYAVLFFISPRPCKWKGEMRRCFDRQNAFIASLCRVHTRTRTRTHTHSHTHTHTHTQYTYVILNGGARRGRLPGQCVGFILPHG